ncbi:MAG: nucleotidyltransferase domain-containing protein [Patescibacteria group bacterium]
MQESGQEFLINRSTTHTDFIRLLTSSALRTEESIRKLQEYWYGKSKDYADQNKIGVYVYGSCANGLAGAESDVDIVARSLLRFDKASSEQVYEMVSAYPEYLAPDGIFDFDSANNRDIYVFGPCIQELLGEPTPRYVVAQRARVLEMITRTKDPEILWDKIRARLKTEMFRQWEGQSEKYLRKLAKRKLDMESHFDSFEDELSKFKNFDMPDLEIVCREYGVGTEFLSRKNSSSLWQSWTGRLKLH